MPDRASPTSGGPVLFLVLLVIVGPARRRLGRRTGGRTVRAAVVARRRSRQPRADRARRDPRAQTAATAARAADALPGGGTQRLRGQPFPGRLLRHRPRPARSACSARPPGPDGPAAAPGGGAVPPARPAGAHVYELIVTVADAHPGKDGDYSHDIPRAEVQPLHPGRSPQQRAAAARHPARPVRLPRASRSAGSGRCATRGSAWRSTRSGGWAAPGARRTRSARCAPPRSTAPRPGCAPADPSRGPAGEALRAPPVPGRHGRATSAGSGARPGLAMVQHVDGFGTPRQKLATYHAVARPRQFRMGFKLFYDEDVRRMSARAVHADPAEGPVRSFQ